MKTTKLAACSLSRARASGRFFAGFSLWRGRPEPIGDGYGRSTDAAGSIRPIATNLVPAAVEVANNNERRSIAAFMNFNPRGRKMKPKLAFYFMPKIRQGRNGMAKAAKLLPLLLIGILMNMPAYGSCYPSVRFEYNFTKFTLCQPAGINELAIAETFLYSTYSNAHNACHHNVRVAWQCPVPVRSRLKITNQIHSTWNREMAACQQHMNNLYERTQGRMCD